MPEWRPGRPLTPPADPSRPRADTAVSPWRADGHKVNCHRNASSAAKAYFNKAFARLAWSARSAKAISGSIIQNSARWRLVFEFSARKVARRCELWWAPGSKPRCSAARDLEGEAHVRPATAYRAALPDRRRMEPRCACPPHRRGGRVSHATSTRGDALIDCGCGPGSITVDLARAVAPGEAIGIDLREDALTQGRTLAQERRIANVAFQAATVYHLPYADSSFDAAFACAVLQHLAAPLAALKELRRVLTPRGVICIADGSSTITFRYPTNPLLQAWDKLRGLEREYRTGRPYDALALRALLREAGFARTQASGTLVTEAGPPAGSLEETRRVAQNHVIRLRGVLGKLAVAQGWATRDELEQMAEALIAWGEAPDAFYARPGFTAIGWA